jgi:hypothetical protein
MPRTRRPATPPAPFSGRSPRYNSPPLGSFSRTERPERWRGPRYRPPDLDVGYEPQTDRDYSPAQASRAPRRARSSRRVGASWEQFGGTAKSGIRIFGKGYSRFQAVYGAVALLSSVLFTLAKFQNVKDTLGDIVVECDQAAFVVEQLDAMLQDPALVDSLASDRAGGRLVAKLEEAREGIQSVIEDMRARLAEYNRNDDLSVTAKIRYFVRDSRKIANLRMKLRRRLDDLQQLMVWLNR